MTVKPRDLKLAFGFMTDITLRRNDDSLYRARPWLLWPSATKP